MTRSSILHWLLAVLVLSCAASSAKAQEVRSQRSCLLPAAAFDCQGSTGAWSGPNGVVVAGAGSRAPGMSASQSARLSESVDGALGRHKDAWQFTASFGPTRTQYFDTDVTIKTSRMDAVLKGVTVHERHTMDAWDVFHKANPLQAIDEPTNTLTLRAENVDKKYAIFLQSFHPKFLFTGKDLHNKVQAKGTIDGRPIDGPYEVEQMFTRWQLTYGLLNFTAGVEKIMTLLKGKAGSVEYAPGLGAGVFLGTADVHVRDPNDQWTSTPYKQKIAAIGPSATLSNRLTYSIPGGRVNVSVTHQLTGSKLAYKAADGKASHGLNYQSVSGTLGVRLYKTRKKRPDLNK